MSAPTLILTRETRCPCGQLLALLSAEGIEIKCRRCKRLETLTFDQLKKIFEGIEPESSDPHAAPAPAPAGSPTETECGCRKMTRKKVT